MSDIYTVRGATFDPARCLPLGDFGSLPDGGLAGLWRMNSAELENEGSAGGALEYTGNAVVEPLWEDGILKIPTPESGSAQWNTGIIQTTQSPFCWFGIHFPVGVTGRLIDKNNSYNMIQTAGSLNASATGSGLAATLYDTSFYGSRRLRWQMFIVNYGSDGIRGLGTRGDIRRNLFADTGSSFPPIVGAGQTRLGNTSTSNPLVGDIALLGYYARGLTETEMRSLRAGMYRFAEAKGISFA